MHRVAWLGVVASIAASVACGPRETPAAVAPRAEASVVEPTPPALVVEPTPAVAPAVAVTGEVAPVPAAVVPAKPPTPSKTWPFAVWDRAEAITYNHVAYGPGIPLRAYDGDSGWSPKIAERRAISGEQGARAVGWVIATRGELEVSKCAFPRHAVVLYAGDTPVGSANVCFECGDILVWPDFEPPPTDAQAGRRQQQQMRGYKQVFPQWERFFRDELGFSLTPVVRP